MLIAEDERNDGAWCCRRRRGTGWTASGRTTCTTSCGGTFAGDHEAYFQDYTGSVEDIVRTLRQGWFYEGQRSKNHGVPRGTPADGLPPAAFVHCIQNHDQVGNRAWATG